MAKYTPTEWKDEIKDANGNLVQQGTPLSAANLKKMETGIAEAVKQTEVVTAQLADTEKQSFNQTKQNAVPYNYQGAVFSFVDDDGTNNFWNTYKAIFEGKGVKASLGIVSSFVGTGVYMTLSRLKELQDAGHEILAHSVAHDAAIYKSTNDLSLVSDATIESDLKNSQQWLIDNGFKGYDTFVFPWGGLGAQSVRYKRLARKYYKYAIDANGTHNTSPVDNMYLKRYFLNSNQDFTTVLKPIIDATVAAKGWLILGTHAGDTTNLNGAYLTQVINYIQSLNVPILPFREASKYKGNALSIGEFTDSSNKLYIGNDGKSDGLGGTGIGVDVMPYNAANMMSDPITVYKVGFSTRPINQNNDTATNIGGTLTTNRGIGDDYSYQTWVPYNASEMYIRHWGSRLNPQAWMSWVKFSTGTSSSSGFNLFTGNRYNVTGITTFPNGVEYCDIPTANASGFPEDLAGTLTTYRNSIGDIYSYQDYHIRGTNKRYSRYWDITGNVWSPWVKISAV